MKNKVICELFIIILMLLIPHVINTVENTQKNSSVTTNYMTIDGNNNFTLTAKINNWTGNGTVLSPINISTLANFLPFQLVIENTNINFEIINYNLVLSNNLIIFFNNVTNGIIKNNKFSGNVLNSYEFSYIENCSNFQITNNKFLFDAFNSFYITGSSNIVFSKNSIENQKSGLDTIFCSTSINGPSTLCGDSGNNKNITITNNYIRTSNGLGLRSLSGIVSNNIFEYGGIGPMQNNYFTSDMTFTNNTLNGKKIIVLINQSNIQIPNDVGELVVIHCSNELITNQTFSNTYDAIKIFSSNNITITNSKFENLGYKILFVSSSNIKFTGNVLENASLYLQSEKNDILSNNYINQENFSLKLTGISTWESTNIQLLNNKIFNCSGYGINFFLTNTSLIKENQIHLNSESGIVFFYSNNNIIINNSIYNNSLDGLVLFHSNDNQISHNSIFTNNEDGLVFSFSNDNQITNNAIFNNTIGIFLAGKGNTFINNSVYGNLQGGTYELPTQGQSNSSDSNQILMTQVVEILFISILVAGIVVIYKNNSIKKK